MLNQKVGVTWAAAYTKLGMIMNILLRVTTQFSLQSPVGKQHIDFSCTKPSIIGTACTYFNPCAKSVPWNYCQLNCGWSLNMPKGPFLTFLYAFLISSFVAVFGKPNNSYNPVPDALQNVTNNYNICANSPIQVITNLVSNYCMYSSWL